MAFTILDGDSFLSTGVGKKINLPSSCDYFKTWNVTQMSLAPATPVVVMAEWFGEKFGLGQTAANDGLRWKKSANTSVLNLDTFATSTASDGFTYVKTVPYVEAQAANAITSITQADGAVVSQTNTYSEGDLVRIYNTTGMLQIGGMVFQISSVSGSGYTLLGLDASGFAAAATAGNTRRVSKFNAVDPEYLYVTSISKATNAVVRTSVDPSSYYVAGMKIHFSIPSDMGMEEINQKTATILSINAATYEITIDLDTSAYSTFAFPASTSSPTAGLFAMLAPAGAKTSFDPSTGLYTGYNFSLQPFHTGQFVPYLYLAGGAQSPAGASGDQINWMSYKLEV